MNIYLITFMDESLDMSVENGANMNFIDKYFVLWNYGNFYKIDIKTIIN